MIITISGKKQSGKSSLGKYIFAKYANKQIGQQRFSVDQFGNLQDIFEKKVIDTDYPSETLDLLFKTYGIKIYSFAYPLKKICTDVLGMSDRQVYGTDSDKNSMTEISWNSLPEETRIKYNKNTEKRKNWMTAREVMEVLGTQIFRCLKEDCWCTGTYKAIAKEGFPLAIITDARHPNEICIGTEIGAKSIRLLRNPFDSKSPSETALDDLPLGEYSAVIHNQDMSLREKHQEVDKYLNRWIS